MSLGVDFVENATNVSHRSLFCWLPSGVLGCRGEERARVEEFDVAVRVLSDKLAAKDPVFFSGVPYQLCYARGGNRIQFFLPWICNMQGQECHRQIHSRSLYPIHEACVWPMWSICFKSCAHWTMVCWS